MISFQRGSVVFLLCASTLDPDCLHLVLTVSWLWARILTTFCPNFNCKMWKVIVLILEGHFEGWLNICKACHLEQCLVHRKCYINTCFNINNSVIINGINIYYCYWLRWTLKNYLSCHEYLLPQEVFSVEFEEENNVSPKCEEVSLVWYHLNKAG